MLVDLLVDVASLIESTIAVEKVSVTPGEPAATEKCSAAYVWGSLIYDADQSTQQRSDIAGCAYKRTYRISYRIDVCVPTHEDGSELTTAEALTTATTFYDYQDQVMCALMSNAVAGTLFDPPNAKKCQDIVIGPLQTDSPQGDRVSATGWIQVDDPCPPEGS